MSLLAIAKINLRKKMDKKMYLEPETEVLEVEISGMLCTSPDDPEIPQGGGEGENQGGGW